jgi:hypothetical protein
VELFHFNKVMTFDTIKGGEVFVTFKPKKATPFSRGRFFKTFY